MKKKQLILLSIVLLVLLAACGGGGNGTNSGGNTSSDQTNTSNNSGSNSSGSSGGNSGGDAPKNVTLRIAWWGGEPRHDYTLKVIDMYQQQNPHVTIEPEYASWDDYWTRLAPQAAANQLPDIIQMDLSYITQYGEKGQLADLTPFLGNQIDVTNISESAISGGRIGDKLYGFNAGVNALQVHFDPAILEKAGISIDSIPDNWTWADYESLAMKAADAGIYFDTGHKADVFFAYYLRTQGKRLYSPDGTQLGYDDDQLFVDFFSMQHRLVKAGAKPTPDITAQIKGLEDDLLVKNQAASVWQWTNQFIGLQQVADRPLEMHPLPGPNQTQGLFLKPSMFWSIAENSQNKEEAAKFLDFFINDIEANKLIRGDRGVPVSSVVKEALIPELTEQQAQVFEFIAWAEKNSSPGDGPDPIGAGEVIAALESITESLYFDQITPEEAAKQFRSEANSILSRNK